MNSISFCKNEAHSGGAVYGEDLSRLQIDKGAFEEIRASLYGGAWQIDGVTTCQSQIPVLTEMLQDSELEGIVNA